MQKGFAGIFIVIGLLITGAVATSGYFYYQQQKVNSINSFEECAKAGYPVMQIYPPRCNTPDGRSFTKELSEEEKKKLASSGDTTGWKTYVDQKLGFEFKHPPDWIKEDICEANPFCIYVTEYEALPTQKEYKPEGMGAEINTKKDFIKYSEAINTGKLPEGYLPSWQFKKVGGKNAIQTYSYNVPGGKYQIITVIITDKAILDVGVNLPIQPVYKQSATSQDYSEIDIVKSEAKLDDIRNGLVDSQTKQVVDNYNQIPPTFKFLDQDEGIADWQVYQSKGDYPSYTDNWDEYNSVNKDIAIPYTISYPRGWKFDGYSVFEDQNGKKIAEFLPGEIILKPGQKCFDSVYKDDSQGQLKFVSKENITLEELKGVKLVEELPHVWYPITYCLSKGDEGFVMTFYEEQLNSKKREIFDQVMTTFKFLE